MNLEARKPIPSGRAATAALCAAMAAASLFVAARPAYADVTILDLVSQGPVTFVTLFLAQLIADSIQNFFSPLCQVLFSWSTDYLTIPYVNTVILGLQGISAFAVVAIRVGVGISSGILLSGGNREQSLGEYVFKSILALVVVAVMPALCALVIRFGNLIYQDVIGGTGGIAESLAWFTIPDDVDLGSLSTASELGSSILWALVGMLVVVVLCFAVGFQFVRRQVEMLVISIVGPIVAAYSATENDSSQVLDLLKKLFGLCCMQWMQYLLVQIALAFGIAWVNGAAGADVLTSLFSGDNCQRFMFCIATFSAALTLPALLDEFTYSSGGSRVGAAAVGAVVSKSMRMPKMPRIKGGQ